MAEISDITIKRTQDTLGKIIKKPVLTDKLLRKPPFKFLHDIIHAVCDTCELHSVDGGHSTSRPFFSDENISFRFTRQVIQTTGFLNGLYTDEELQAENVKERDAKIVFLQKTIDVLSKEHIRLHSNYWP